mmetsp:Transcript_136946/g.381782  ORF Transcript_136946/g.381782 Transcript_136946/m.381782 type:complete len:201 (-) Transcript_136946:349-951(-)
MGTCSHGIPAMTVSSTPFQLSSVRNWKRVNMLCCTLPKYLSTSFRSSSFHISCWVTMISVKKMENTTIMNRMRKKIQKTIVTDSMRPRASILSSLKDLSSRTIRKTRRIRRTRAIWTALPWWCPSDIALIMKSTTPTRMMKKSKMFQAWSGDVTKNCRHPITKLRSVNSITKRKRKLGFTRPHKFIWFLPLILKGTDTVM